MPPAASEQLVLQPLAGQSVSQLGKFLSEILEGWEREPGLGGPTGPWNNLLSPSRHIPTCQESFYLSRADTIVRKVIK